MVSWFYGFLEVKSSPSKTTSWSFHARFFCVLHAQRPTQGVFTRIPHVTEPIGSFISSQIPWSIIKCSIHGKHAQHCIGTWSIKNHLLKNSIQQSLRQCTLFPIACFWPSFRGSNSIDQVPSAIPTACQNHVATYQFEEDNFKTHCRLGNYELHAMWK